MLSAQPFVIQSDPLLDSRVARITVVTFQSGGRLGKKPGMGKNAAPFEGDAVW